MLGVGLSFSPGLYRLQADRPHISFETSPFLLLVISCKETIRYVHEYSLTRFSTILFTVAQMTHHNINTWKNGLSFWENIKQSPQIMLFQMATTSPHIVFVFPLGRHCSRPGWMTWIVEQRLDFSFLLPLWPDVLTCNCYNHSLQPWCQIRFKDMEPSFWYIHIF